MTSFWLVTDPCYALGLVWYGTYKLKAGKGDHLLPRHSSDREEKLDWSSGCWTHDGATMKRQSSSCWTHDGATMKSQNSSCWTHDGATMKKSEDRLSENVEGVKEAKIMKARDTLDVTLYCWRFQRLA